MVRLWREGGGRRPRTPAGGPAGAPLRRGGELIRVVDQTLKTDGREKYLKRQRESQQWPKVLVLPLGHFEPLTSSSHYVIINFEHCGYVCTQVFERKPTWFYVTTGKESALCGASSSEF